MRIIEELMNRRWILKSQDPQLYYEIKDNAKGIEKRSCRRNSAMHSLSIHIL